MGGQAPVLCSIGVLVLIIHQISFLTTMFISPGVPSLEVTEEDIINVMQKKSRWCPDCKLVMHKDVEH